MSLIPIGVSVAIAVAEGLLGPAFTRVRNINGMVADITIEELHIDQTEITQHPVEYGSNINDHAFELPQRVHLTCGWSNSSLQSDGDPNYVQEVYEAFLALKVSHTPFSIVTGKRMYENMLIERITERTDEHWENAMKLVIECRQVIIVQTQTVTVNPNVVEDPAANAPTKNSATSLAPAPSYNPPSYNPPLLTG